MGPTSVDVGGREPRYALARTGLPGFNGADISRCRRVQPDELPMVPSAPASMGPTSVDVGGRPRSLAARRPGLDASMGPTSVDVGGLLVCLRFADFTLLQWGRHQSMSEGFWREDSSRSWFRLQWGRHQSMSEGCGAVVRGERHAPRASMGPTSVDVGRWKIPSEVELTRATLQWGRHQSMSEGGAMSSRYSGGISGFNGADISRCRRVRAGKIPADRASKLLQWGRHQSMSEGRGVEHAVVRAFLDASMGPTSVDVGGARIRTP